LEESRSLWYYGTKRIPLIPRHTPLAPACHANYKCSATRRGMSNILLPKLEWRSGPDRRRLRHRRPSLRAPPTHRQFLRAQLPPRLKTTRGAPTGAGPWWADPGAAATVKTRPATPTFHNQFREIGSAQSKSAAPASRSRSAPAKPAANPARTSLSHCRRRGHRCRSAGNFHGGRNRSVGISPVLAASLVNLTEILRLPRICRRRQRHTCRWIAPI
jgi:hypothetical protein